MDLVFPFPRTYYDCCYFSFKDPKNRTAVQPKQKSHHYFAQCCETVSLIPFRPSARWCLLSVGTQLSLQLVSRAVATRPTHPVLANALLTADAAQDA